MPRRKAKVLGMRVSILDATVKKHQETNALEENSIVEELEPWGDFVNGHDLLNDMVTILENHVILPKGSAVSLAIWVLGAFAMDAWRIWPKILITPR